MRVTVITDKSVVYIMAPGYSLNCFVKLWNFGNDHLVIMYKLVANLLRVSQSSEQLSFSHKGLKCQLVILVMVAILEFQP